MDAQNVLINLVLGGLLGFLGQGLRVFAGLKKLHDTTQQPLKGNDQFDPSRLSISLFLGFITGGLSVIGMMNGANDLSFDKETIITIVGSGYAGVDFLESFLSKYIATGNTVELQSQRSVSPSQLLLQSERTEFGIQNIGFGADESPRAPKQNRN